MTDETAPVPRKSPEDYEAEARIRAHLREQMKERRINIAELARRLKTDDGNLNRILKGGRGLGLGLALRICRNLKIRGTMLLEENPKPEYWDDLWAPPDKD